MNMNKIYTCPFFFREEAGGARIICDSATVVCFPCKDSADAYRKQYCCHVKGWHDCTVAAMYEEHYERISAKPKGDKPTGTKKT